MFGKIKSRKCIYIAGEGSSEQSFIKWLQILADENSLYVHLDCEPLNGGGYQRMLKDAVYCRKKKERNKSASSILLLDGDRSKEDDGWSIDILRTESEKQNFSLCVQLPNHEGLLLRMFPGNEQSSTRGNTYKKLQQKWPEYEKPMDAYALKSKFSLTSLLNVAKSDKEIKQLLILIGFLNKNG